MMFSTQARRSLLLNANVVESVVARQQLRLFSSNPPSFQNRRDLHSTARREADATADSTTAATEAVAPSTTKTFSSIVAKRFATTAEVTISKIFPAGFGWQTASIVADQSFGYAPDTMSFALTTGAGDAIGVLMGHVSFYAAKKAFFLPKINMAKELHTGILLGSAAFCSGTVWQPIVNALQGAELPFMQVFGGTWVGCGAAFYVGLRAGRTILSGFLEHIEEPTFKNSMDDKSLSMAIGSATGFFVGTDAAYLPDQNFLIDVVGIKDGTPDLVGCAIAGTSTSMGFVSTQAAFNLMYPGGKCWND